MSLNYPLQSLLSLRYYKEDKAKLELKKQESMLDQAVKKYEQAKLNYTQYKEKIPELVEKEYAVIIGKECLMSDIDKVKEKVAAIEQVAINLEMAVFDAEKEMNVCKENVEKAKNEVSEKRKDCTKIEKHKEIWLEIEKKEQERKEEVELEP